MLLFFQVIDSGKRRVSDASSGMQLYYLSSCNEDGSDPEYEKLGWKKLEKYDPSQQRWKCLARLVEGGDLSEVMSGDPDDMTICDYYASLPFALAVLFSACKAKGLKVSCVLCYCSEGDNMPESFQLAEVVCKLLGQGTEQFHGEVAIMDNAVFIIEDAELLTCVGVPEISRKVSSRCFWSSDKRFPAFL